MKIKNLNIVLFFLFVMLLGLSSCSSDNSLQLPEVNIGSLSKFQDHSVSIPQDEVLSLSAEVKSQLTITKISWKVNGMEKASTAKFDFSASEVGSYKIVLSVTNEDGMTADSVNVTVYGKYRDGVFVLNEGNMTSENGFLTFISPKGEVTDSVYYKVNGSSLGNVTQSLFIADKKMYIISQNGNRMNGDGMLVVADAETLKKIAAYNDELADLSWPTHVAVVGNDVYLRDNKGVYLFNPITKQLSFIQGTDGALKNAMAVVKDKIFVPGNKAIFVLQNGALVKTITMPGSVSGVIKSSDGNIWASCTTTPAQIAKINSADYTITTNELPADVKISAGWGATPGISAKGDSIYFSNAGPKVYRHIFSKKQTDFLTDVSPLIEHFGMLYNNLTVNPSNGDIYINTIEGYGLSFLINDITIWSDSGNALKLKSDYQNHIHFPAGTFFPTDYK